MTLGADDTSEHAQQGRCMHISVREREQTLPEAAAEKPSPKRGRVSDMGSGARKRVRFQLPSDASVCEPLLSAGDLAALEKATRGFTVSVSGDGIVRHSVDQNTTAVCDFDSVDCTSHHVLLQTADVAKLRTHLEHYARCKAAAPGDTSAVVVLSSRNYRAAVSMLKRFKLGMSCIWLKRPTKRPGTVLTAWYDAPKVLQAAAVGGQVRPHRQGIHLQCSIAGRPARATLDCGASHCFLRSGYAAEHGIEVQPDDATIALADGSTARTRGRCYVRVQLGTMVAVVNCYVVDLAVQYDLLLGMDFMIQRGVTISCNSENVLVTASRNGKCTRLPLEGTVQGTPSTDDKPVFDTIVSALQLRRAMRKGAVCLWVRLKDTSSIDQESEQDKPPDQAREEEAPVHNTYNRQRRRRQKRRQQPVCGAVSASTRDTSTGLVDPARLDKLLAQYEKTVFVDELPNMSDIPDRGISVEVIPVVPGSKPPYRKQYRTTPAEKAEVVKRVRELLDKNMIEPSKSPFSAPILFVRKKDGSLRLVLDYRALNAITVKNRYPIPRIDDLLDALKGAQVFSCLDLSGGYHQLQLQDSDKPKTAFATHLGHYQWRVMPMGISNAPSVFQATMNHLFQHMIGKSVFIYLDDILIASRTPEEHEHHLAEVLRILADNKLYANRAKCSFNLPEVHYLGHIVGRGGVRPDPRKLEVVREWPRPKSAHEVRSFLGLTQYFRRFIKDYSLIAAPLHKLLQKESKCVWTKECEAAFLKLKQALLSAPVLSMPDYNEAYELEVWTDASNTAVGAVLMQNGHPIAYESRRFSAAERNYNTTDREMLAIIHALRVWRCYLEGAQFKVKCDHKALSFFKTKAEVTPRQARWLEFLERFNLSIDHVAGKNNVSDVLSRVEHGAEGPVLAVVTRRPKDKRQLTCPSPSGEEWEEEIRAAVAADEWYSVPSNTRGLQCQSGIWYKKEKVVLPSALRSRCLQQAHDSPVGGHKGVTKTLELVQRYYWWPTVRKDVVAYVTTCASCQRNKARNMLPGGTLQPLPIPEEPWQSVSMDYVTGLPCTTAGYDAVYVVLDRLTKMAHFIPCTKDITAVGTADLFVREVVRLHGYPLDIVSDRDAKFSSEFWRRLFELVGTKLRMSSAFHPQTDGGTERLNRILEEYLRAYINPEQNDWDKWLPLAEFAYNNSKQESIGCTPFYLNYGRHPRLPETPTVSGVRNQAAAEMAVELDQRVKAAKSLLQAAQQRQKKYVDKKRREVQFAVGDMVMLDTRNIRLRTPGAQKLMPKYIGPFKVLERFGPVAYKLDLPHNMRRMHPVFHVSLLHAYKADGRRQPPPPPIRFADEDWFELDCILGERTVRKNRCKITQYLCAFKGQGPEANEWCDEDGVTEVAVREWRQSRSIAN